MNQRENLLRAVRFETPETIPMVFHINPACWQHYPHDALQELVAAHPLLFPDFAPLARVTPTFSPVQRRDAPYRDPWGCVWHTSEDGITGTVTEHPLADWAAFADYRAPDPDRTDGLWPVNWAQVAQDIEDAKAQGKLLQTGLRHGHTFLQLCDIRGYQALMYDMADDDPRLRRLIAMLEEFNLAVVERYLAAGAEWMSYPEDLGMQVGPMVSPRHFRKYIRPSYQRLMRPALDAGCVVHMHSDGDIRLLVDDMLEAGVAGDQPAGPGQRHRLDRGALCRQGVHRPGHRPPADHLRRHARGDRCADPRGGDEAGPQGGRSDDDLRPVSGRPTGKCQSFDGCDGAVCNFFSQ